jgi:hypothetical protein
LSPPFRVVGGERLADLLGDPLESLGAVAMRLARADAQRAQADELGEVGDRLELATAPRAEICRSRRLVGGVVAPYARATVQALGVRHQALLFGERRARVTTVRSRRSLSACLRARALRTCVVLSCSDRRGGSVACELSAWQRQHRWDCRAMGALHPLHRRAL